MLLVAALISIPLGLDLYMPVPEDNPLTAEKVALGRRLFRDPRLSRDGTIACTTCHDPARAFTDGRSIAVGVSGRKGRRNVPTLVNRAWGRLFFWDGRVHTLEEQVLRPIEDPNEMDLPASDAAARVGVSTSELSQALAGYVRSIMSGDSPYDRFVAGNRNALTDEQQMGLQIFRGKGNCTRCHVGPTFTDELSTRCSRSSSSTTVAATQTRRSIQKSGRFGWPKAISALSWPFSGRSPVHSRRDCVEDD
jgi:cytochrome c peroxidase